MTFSTWSYLLYVEVLATWTESGAVVITTFSAVFDFKKGGHGPPGTYLSR